MTTWAYKDIKKIKVPDLETGKSWLHEIRQERREYLGLMRTCKDNTEWELLEQKAYRLKQIKVLIHKQMAQLVEAAR